MKILKLILCLLLGFFLLVGQSCKKLVKVDLPVDKITGESAYGNVNTAVAALNSVYADLASGVIVNPMAAQLGLAADELKYQFPSVVYQNNFSDSSSELFNIWKNFYANDLYRLNSLLEGVPESKGIIDRSRKTLCAEAKFTRAFLYFYLVNLYGDVPLVLSTDFQTNSNISRTSKEEVYKQIIKDLTEARLDLPENFLGIDLSSATIDRVRPTKMAASALLARVYLFHRDYELAELEATKVISNSKLSLSSLDDVFKKNSSETIWALQPNYSPIGGESNNSQEGYLLTGTFFGSTPVFQISNYLYDAFETNDLRKIKWISTISNGGIDYHYSFKYKIGRNQSSQVQAQEEYSVILRLSEQYLIRAEARAMQNKLMGTENAQSDLDSIRERAGLGLTTATDKSEVLTAIWHERRVELFTEWGGYRWLDLKRTMQIDMIMGPIATEKGGQWSGYKSLLPIPYFEFVTNPALRGHQNPGYPEKL